ncbi:YciI family protein [Demequina capsici]|uniref:YciI family protein n=1 Tax=Demequina capsici TaxID=3075620 RepID=A0AA96J8C4_9MICO|nr:MULTISPECIES: YciI family protein [unclassified Demequina]WNM25932.1 YciI family protein [Demequina sp. OYTSA14]WNM26037.1 YciI family protein [Demequina sp. PMTSA13]
MTMWAIQYGYDSSQAEQMAAVRPSHRAYLAALMDAGSMLAFGRFDDELEPGAILLAEADSRDAVDALLAEDPYQVHGLVASCSVRPWAGAVRG